MSKGVTVPASLLADIFRLLEYMDRRSVHDESHYHKSGYSQRVEQDTALWELKLKIKQLQGQAVETYLLSIDDATEEEKRGLMQWVAVGNSIYDNPYSLYDESGCTMDFIKGCRIGMEMAGDPSRFFGIEPDKVSNGGWDDEIPF